MADAAVGDDVYGDDPRVRLLEERTAALLGKEDDVYMVRGTMTNQVAIRAHSEPGDAVLFDQNAHVYLLEGGAPASLSGVLHALELVAIHGAHSPQEGSTDPRACERPRWFTSAILRLIVRAPCTRHTNRARLGRLVQYASRVLHVRMRRAAMPWKDPLPRCTSCWRRRGQQVEL